MTRAETAVAVIADIVGSRALADREGAQRAILDAWRAAEEDVPGLRPAWASVGDEFQALYRTWQEALRATLRVAVALPEGVLLRYGIGAGDRRLVSGADDAAEGIEDGSAWYRAREAVQRAESRAAGLSSAFVAEDAELTAAVDAALVLRDHVVGRLKAREVRLAAALLAGATQEQAARAERITQSAVSQAVARSGVDRLLAVDAALAAGGAA